MSQPYPVPIPIPQPQSRPLPDSRGNPDTGRVFKEYPSREIRVLDLTNFPQDFFQLKINLITLLDCFLSTFFVHMGDLDHTENPCQKI